VDDAGVPQTGWMIHGVCLRFPLVGGDEQMMTVRADDRADAVVLAVDGEIDAMTAPRLRASVAEALRRLDGRPLVVDLTGVTFLGSPGLQVLLDCAGETLRVVVDHNRPVTRPIELTGLDAVLPLFSSVPDALGAR
jgi:anti-sigma B factor antagonist